MFRSRSTSVRLSRCGYSSSGSNLTFCGRNSLGGKYSSLILFVPIPPPCLDVIVPTTHCSPPNRLITEPVIQTHRWHASIRRRQMFEWKSLRYVCGAQFSDVSDPHPYFAYDGRHRYSLKLLDARKDPM